MQGYLNFLLKMLHLKTLQLQMVFNLMNLMEDACFKSKDGNMYFGGINGF